jgi:hypothetical protein
MKQSIKSIIAVITLVFISGCAETYLRSQDEKEGVLLLGATTHLGNGDVIYNSAVGIKDGYVTLLADAAIDQLDLSKFDVDQLGPDFHIYPFKKTQLGNSGIVLARKDDKSISISIRDKELERCIQIGCEAMLLICKGSIDDFDQFKVDFVYMGQEKVHILKQSDYVISSGDQE